MIKYLKMFKFAQVAQLCFKIDSLFLWKIIPKTFFSGFYCMYAIEIFLVILLGILWEFCRNTSISNFVEMGENLML